MHAGAAPADVDEKEELTTMFCIFTDTLVGVRTLADLLSVRMRLSRRCGPCMPDRTQ